MQLKQYSQEFLRQPADFLTAINNTFCFKIVHQGEWKSVINNIFSR